MLLASTANLTLYLTSHALGRDPLPAAAGTEAGYSPQHGGHGWSQRPGWTDYSIMSDALGAAGALAEAPMGPTVATMVTRQLQVEVNTLWCVGKRPPPPPPILPRC